MRRNHKLKAGLNTEWAATALALPPDWDAGLPEDQPLLRNALAVQEAAKLPDVSQSYAILRSGDGSILARAAFQVLRAKPEHVKESALPPWQYRAWKLFTQTVRPKLLTGGQLFRHDMASVQWDTSLSPYEAFMWYNETTKAAARREGATAVLIKELPDALTPHFLHSAPQYLLLRNDISMQLAVSAEWCDMKDYEKSLKHKYAQRFRKVRQSWAGLRVQELSGEEVFAHSADIYRLYRRVTEHQPVRMGLLNEAFIPSLKQAYGNDLKVWAIWEDNTMVAFASGWVHEESFDMFYIGFDYERNSALNLYFNILFFAIEQAIALRKPLLILGRTALEAKARVGCRPQYLNTFLYVRNPVLRRIVAALQARLGEGGSEWEQRHPFKNQD